MHMPLSLLLMPNNFLQREHEKKCLKCVKKKKSEKNSNNSRKFSNQKSIDQAVQILAGMSKCLQKDMKRM